MRLSVDQRTRYRFDRPRSRIAQLLRLTPDDNDEQAIANWDVHVDCDARLRNGRDGYGNRTIMLYVEGPVEGIELFVSGEVLTNDGSGIVHGSTEPLPPSLYLRATGLTPADPAIGAFATRTVGDSGDTIERLHRLNDALHRHVACRADAEASGVTAAFDRGLANATDLAHAFIVASRAMGWPSRYVSGYRAATGDLAMPHAWAEAFVAGLGWVSFDPTTGLCADDSYIRVAVALDATGAAPLAGTGLGRPVGAEIGVGQGAAQD